MFTLFFRISRLKRVAFRMAKINFIKKISKFRKRKVGEQSLSSGLCLGDRHGCPRLEGNVMDKGQTELGVDIRIGSGYPLRLRGWNYPMEMVLRLI